MREDFATVIGETLETLIRTTYYFCTEDREYFDSVYKKVADATPKFQVHPIEIRKNDPITGRRIPTGEGIAFPYSILLGTNWGLCDGPGQKNYGQKIILDDMGFQLATGKVILAPDGSLCYERATTTSDDSYWTTNEDGKETKHHDPEALFPSFTDAQEEELESMALAMTQGLIRTYGTDFRALWDKTIGTWWDVQAPGIREKYPLIWGQ